MRNWNNINTVTLKRFTGEVWAYNSLEECLSSHRCLLLSKTIGDKPFPEIFINFQYHIIDNDSGLLIPLWKLKEVSYKLDLYNYYWWKVSRPYKYRDGPVPGTSCRGRYCWYRRIKTTSERKNAIKDKSFVRAKRNQRNIPNSYDDIVRHVEKNWKKYRKTQYK